jgi:hypothetical protein
VDVGSEWGLPSGDVMAGTMVALALAAHLSRFMGFGLVLVWQFMVDSFWGEHFVAAWHHSDDLSNTMCLHCVVNPLLRYATLYASEGCALIVSLSSGAIVFEYDCMPHAPVRAGCVCGACNTGVPQHWAGGGGCCNFDRDALLPHTHAGCYCTTQRPR